MTLTPAQRDVAAELLNRLMQLHCHHDAAMLVDQLEAAATRGHSVIRIVRWVQLLDRVPTPVDGATAAVAQTSLSVAPLPGTARLLDPSLPPPRPSYHRRAPRPTGGTCVDCGSAFEMNPTGRPAKRCEEHRRSA